MNKRFPTEVNVYPLSQYSNEICCFVNCDDIHSFDEIHYFEDEALENHTCISLNEINEYKGVYIKADLNNHEIKRFTQKLKMHNEYYNDNVQLSDIIKYQNEQHKTIYILN